MTPEKLDIHLGLHSTPLAELRQDENWWHLGTISVSKKHATFTAGYWHSIKTSTSFRIERFDVQGRDGWAVILESGGTPSEYFVGWLPPEDEMKARQWAETLNSAIQQRLAEQHEGVHERGADSSRLTFEQGNEYAPDSPWGYQRVTVSLDGQLEYEHKERDRVS